MMDEKPKVGDLMIIIWKNYREHMVPRQCEFAFIDKIEKVTFFENGKHIKTIYGYGYWSKTLEGARINKDEIDYNPADLGDRYSNLDDNDTNKNKIILIPKDKIDEDEIRNMIVLELL